MTVLRETPVREAISVFETPSPASTRSALAAPTPLAATTIE
jgi:hypothetical protein